MADKLPKRKSKRKSKAKSVCFCAGSKINRCDIITLGTLNKCCWCSDTRTAKEIKDPTVYIDSLGDVKPLKFGIKYPRDIGYCPKCKKTKISSSELYNKISTKIKNYKSDSESDSD